MAKKDNKKGLILGLLAIGGIFLLMRKKPDDGSGFSGGAIGARGLDNGNPLNIKLSNINWRNKVPNDKNTDGTFEQFNDIIDGYRASMINLRTYHDQGIKTIKDIIDTWAPDNYKGGYLNFVANETGQDVYRPISANEIRSLQYLLPLVKAMAIFENGITFRQHIYDNDIEQGYARI